MIQCGILFLHILMTILLIRIIDVFHHPFRRFIPIDKYRYAICGGANLLFDLLLYFIFYNFIFAKQNFNLGFVVLSPHVASLFAVFPITFTSGFLLNRFITFPDSNLNWKTQVIRYFLVVMGALVFVYVMLKILVDWLGFYPTPSRFLTIFITVAYSYFSQKKFSFKIV